MPPKKQASLNSVFYKLLEAVMEAKELSDAQSQAIVGSKIADISEPAEIERVISEYRATSEHKVYELLKSTSEALKGYGVAPRERNTLAVA